MMNAKPLTSNTVTPPEAMGSVDGTTVAVVVVSSELSVAVVEVASELVEAAEVVASVVTIVVVELPVVVVAAVLVSFKFGQHKTL